MIRNGNPLEEKQITYLFTKIKPICGELTSELRNALQPIQILPIELKRQIQTTISDLEDVLEKEKDKLCAKAFESCFLYVSFPVNLILERDFLFQKQNIALSAKENKQKEVSFFWSLQTIEKCIKILRILVEKCKDFLPDHNQNVLKVLETIENLFIIYLPSLSLNEEEKEQQDEEFFTENIKSRTVREPFFSLDELFQEILGLFEAFSQKNLNFILENLISFPSEQETAKDMKKMPVSSFQAILATFLAKLVEIVASASKISDENSTRRSKNKQIQQKVLEVLENFVSLLCLATKSKEDEENYKKQKKINDSKEIIVESLQNFFPGITGGLLSVISSINDVKIKTKSIRPALRTLGNLIVSTCNSENSQISQFCETEEQNDDYSKENKKEDLKKLEKTLKKETENLSDNENPQIQQENAPEKQNQKKNLEIFQNFVSKISNSQKIQQNSEKSSQNPRIISFVQNIRSHFEPLLISTIFSVDVFFSLPEDRETRQIWENCALSVLENCASLFWRSVPSIFEAILVAETLKIFENTKPTVLVQKEESKTEISDKIFQKFNQIMNQKPNLRQFVEKKLQGSFKSVVIHLKTTVFTQNSMKTRRDLVILSAYLIFFSKSHADLIFAKEIDILQLKRNNSSNSVFNNLLFGFICFLQLDINCSNPIYKTNSIWNKFTEIGNILFDQQSDALLNSPFFSTFDQNSQNSTQKTTNIFNFLFESFPKIPFLFIIDNCVLEWLNFAIQSLGNYEAFWSSSNKPFETFNFILESFRSNIFKESSKNNQNLKNSVSKPENSLPQLFYIINHFIRGRFEKKFSFFDVQSFNQSNEEVENSLLLLIQDILDPIIWEKTRVFSSFASKTSKKKQISNKNQLVISETTKTNENESDYQLNYKKQYFHVVCSCLALQFFNISLCILPSASVSMQLIRILYPILEKLSSPFVSVQQSSLVTLLAISMKLETKPKNSEESFQNLEQFSLKNVQMLIQKLIFLNSDYLIDEITFRMKNLSIYPEAPLILKSLFWYATLPSAKNEKIQDIDEILEENSQKNTENSRITKAITTLLEDSLDSVFLSINTLFSEGISSSKSKFDEENEKPKSSSIAFEWTKQERTPFSFQNLEVNFASSLFVILDCVVQVLSQKRRRKEEKSTTPEENEEIPQEIIEENEEKAKERFEEFKKHRLEDLKREKRHKIMKLQKKREIDMILNVASKVNAFLQMNNAFLLSKLIEILDHALEYFIFFDKNAQNPKKSIEIYSNEVFQLISDVWPNLILILNRSMWSSSSASVVNSSILKLFKKMCQYFGEFLHGRIVSDLFPIIERYLRQNSLQRSYYPLKRTEFCAKSSKNSKNDQEFCEFLQATDWKFKIDSEILNILLAISNPDGLISQKLSVFSSSGYGQRKDRKGLSCYAICETVFWFLEEKQPISLKEQTKNLFLQLHLGDCYSVSLFLHELLAQSDQENKRIKKRAADVDKNAVSEILKRIQNLK